MDTIQICNIGPIRDTGKSAITPVLLFVGKQSSGKSTVMKIISYCRWFEKKLMVSGNDLLYQYTHYLRFYKELKRFHRMDDSFFSEESFITYESDMIRITLNGVKSNVRVERKVGFSQNRYNSKLSFIPSERNLVSAIKNIDRAYRSNELDSLFNFIFEWGEARENYTTSNPLELKVADNMQYFYNQKDGSDSIRLTDINQSFSTFYASSGVQSALPVEVMANYLTAIVGTSANVTKNSLQQLLQNILEENRSETLDLDKLRKNEVLRVLNYQNIQLFIEEPEQNLYPESQKQLVLSLVSAVKQAADKTSHNSYLTLTTHSPYVVSTLNVLMKAAEAFKADPMATAESVPAAYILPPGSISAYYINEGVLTPLLDDEINMISGVEMDSVSDWVDDKIERLNEIIYG